MGLTRKQVVKQFMDMELEIISYPCVDCLVRPTCAEYNGDGIKVYEKLLNGSIYNVFRYDMLKCHLWKLFIAYRNILNIRREKCLSIRTKVLDNHVNAYTDNLAKR